MHLSPQEQKIQEIITPAIVECGFRLIRTRLLNEAHGTILQIMAEDPKTRNLGVDDCAKISREIAALLDVEDPIDGRYRLEISSPGIDRPLTEEQDFIDFTGYEAKIEIEPALEGQKRFRGWIRDVKDGCIILETDRGESSLPIASLYRAKLAMTDDLLKRASEAAATAKKLEDETNEDLIKKTS